MPLQPVGNYPSCHLIYSNIVNNWEYFLLYVYSLKYPHKTVVIFQAMIKNLLSFDYSRLLRSSAPSFALKYAGAMSNTVLQPCCPSLYRRNAALA